MESNYDKTKKLLVAKHKEKDKDGKYVLDKQKADLDSLCTQKIHPVSYVNHTDALKEYNNHTLTTEFTKVLQDGTRRWYWIIRDRRANNVGYVLGTPSREQREDKTGKVRNNAWLSNFDFMELRAMKIAG